MNVKRLIIILLALLISLPIAAQIFVWKMDVQEVAWEGVYDTKDTLVAWGIRQDTICFRFNYQLRCFHNIQKQVWYDYNDSTRAAIILGMTNLAEHGRNYYQHHSAFLKQNHLNELYVVEFIRDDIAITMIVSNLVQRIPKYKFIHWLKCNACPDK